MKILTLSDVVDIHDVVIRETSGLDGFLNKSNLESVIASQNQNIYGMELYPSVLHKAALILRGIICNHPFFGWK